MPGEISRYQVLRLGAAAAGVESLPGPLMACLAAGVGPSGRTRRADRATVDFTGRFVDHCHILEVVR